MAWNNYMTNPYTAPRFKKNMSTSDNGGGSYNSKGDFTPAPKASPTKPANTNSNSYSYKKRKSKSSKVKGYAETDAYKKQREMMAKSRKNIEGAFRTLLESMGPTYQRYRTEYGAAADKTLAQRKQELLGQQMAYGTADSEQRQQAEERLAAEIFGQRESYYSKLAEQEAAQRSEAAYKQALALSGLDEQMANSYIDEWKTREALRQQEYENSLRAMSGGGEKQAWSMEGYTRDQDNNKAVTGIHRFNKYTGQSEFDELDKPLYMDEDDNMSDFERIMRGRY